MADLTPLAREVWEKFASLDVGERIEQKGRFSYLSWVWAWDTLKRHYPDTVTKFDVVWFPGETAEIQCTLTVRSGVRVFEGSGSLAVKDNASRPIRSPSSVDINNAKMRALVKTIALVTGLGLYIYAGEDVPHTQGVDEPGQERRERAPEDEALATLRARLKEQAELLGGRENIPPELLDLGISPAIEDKRKAVEAFDRLLESRAARNLNQPDRKPWEKTGYSANV